MEGKKPTGELRNGVKKKTQILLGIPMPIYCIVYTYNIYPLGKNHTDNGVYKHRRSGKKSAAAKAISAASSIYTNLYLHIIWYL